ncbi:MAG: DUF2946 family protein [Alphaproteobacteria bacterium]
MGLRLRSLGTSRRRAGRSAAWRHDLGWLAIAALLFQIILTSAHLPQGWSAAAPPALCAAGGQDGAAAPASSDHSHHTANQHDCPICRTVPIVSASLAPVTIALLPISTGTALPAPAPRVDGMLVESSTQAQPRAPPARA